MSVPELLHCESISEVSAVEPARAEPYQHIAKVVMQVAYDIVDKACDRILTDLTEAQQGAAVVEESLVTSPDMEAEVVSPVVDAVPVPLAGMSDDGHDSDSLGDYCAAVVNPIIQTDLRPFTRSRGVAQDLPNVQPYVLEYTCNRHDEEE